VTTGVVQDWASGDPWCPGGGYRSSGGGIGTALTDALREAGTAVVTIDLPGRGADRAVDLSDRAATQAAFTGLDGLEIVVANAGVGVTGQVTDLGLVQAPALGGDQNSPASWRSPAH